MTTHRVDVEASDPDGDPLTYSYVGEDNAMVISPSGATADVVISELRSTARVTVVVEDGNGNRATRDIGLLSDNRSPTITAFEADDYRVRPGESTVLTAVITDEDGDAVECSAWIATGAFRGALGSVQLSSGNVCTATFAATSNRNGLVTIVVNATDNRGGRSSGVLVLRVARDFTLVGSLDTSPLKAYALDYTTDGMFFVGEAANEVMVFDSSGAILGPATPVPEVDGGKLYVRALAVDRTRPDEPLYFGSQNGLHREKVYVFDQSLAYQDAWTLLPNTFPHYLLVRPDGSVLISDDERARILVRNPDGTVETWAEGLSKPRQIARDPLTGNIYVVKKGNPRVVVLNDEGVFLREWRGVNGDFIEPPGIAVDRRHEIVVVADTGHNRLQVFDLEGNYLLTWSSPDEVSMPRYTIIGPDGLFYIASFGDEKVHILDYQ